MSELPRITPLVIAWVTMEVTVDTFITGMLVKSNLLHSKHSFTITSYIDHRVLSYANWFPKDGYGP